MSRFSLAFVVVVAVVGVMLLFSSPASQENTNHQESIPAGFGSVSIDEASYLAKSAKDVDDNHQDSAAAEVFTMASGPSRKGSGH